MDHWDAAVFRSLAAVRHREDLARGAAYRRLLPSRTPRRWRTGLIVALLTLAAYLDLVASTPIGSEGEAWPRLDPWG